MKIFVASAFEAGSRFAHAQNTIKMAQGFAKLGHDVTLVCLRPDSGAVADSELKFMYGLQIPLRWAQLPSRVGRRKLDRHWHFGWIALALSLIHKPDLIYSRSYIFPHLASRAGLPVVAESHAHVGELSPLFLKMIAASKRPAFRGLVTIAESLKSYYVSLGAPPEKILVLPDAVDLGLFARPPALPPSPYPQGLPHVVYSGHLYDYKGIPTILEAARQLPAVHFDFVGGAPQDVERHRAKVSSSGMKNITFHGMKPQSELPPYLWHADGLLLTHTLNHPSAAWTSPLKLGEYLASGKPVIASDIPALRAWVSEEEVKFVPPDNGEKLAEAIQTVLQNPADSARMAGRALEKSAALSYERRASGILQLYGISHP